MTDHPAFTLVEDREIEEIASVARLYRHNKTGGEVLSLISQDENKVFGITFKTPPADSTGVAHILEHSVLCGSEKYPLRKPFVEMARGSLQTFLNAMTFPDKTAYPVASQNLADFYNLVDVYLDATLHPVLSRDTFRQEGWHFEAESADAPLAYKGVVFNEMKGAYSDPDTAFSEAMRKALVPDTIYAHSSGGDPRVMPELTYEQFADFHKSYYHPSNARVVFHGDDDPAERLEIVDRAFSRFEPADPAPDIAVQKPFAEPVEIEAAYAADAAEETGGPARDGRVGIAWLLDEPQTEKQSLALGVLGHVLAGTSASPLKRRLDESGLGERVIGHIAQSIRQPIAVFGLRGMDPDNAGRVETLVLDELERLAREGLPEKAVEAALNSIEFQLRELNTGSRPRGISLMFAALQNWLHGKDPLEALAFAEPLATLKAEIAADPALLSGMIRTHLLDNAHRARIVLRADPDIARREAEAERERLEHARAAMSDADIEQTIADTRDLRKLQNTPDSPEAVARLPRLGLEDLPRDNIEIPSETARLCGIETLFHELPTNGIVYLDLGFNLRVLDQAHLPFLPLFSRALTQTGTDHEDFADLIQHIGRTTGGIHAQNFVSAVEDSDDAAAWLILRGKATPDHAGDLISILRDVISGARFDNRDRIRQLVREAKSGLESRLAPAGHQLAGLRLGAGLSEAGWLGEQTGGISQLFFLRDLEKRIEDDFDSVSAILFEIRDRLFGKANAVANVTATGEDWTRFQAGLSGLLGGLPAGHEPAGAWDGANLPGAEGLTFPAQVNYVAQGFNLFETGYARTGAAAVALQHLNMTYLWDRIRVEGGAYGGFSSFNQTSGNFQFGSYRDPNLLGTLDVYEAAGTFLRQPVDEAALTRSIIGVIGTMDRYMLPDAKGFTALTRHLVGETPERRQKRRDEVLGATGADFEALGNALDAAGPKARTVVLGSAEAIAAANDERDGFLSVTRVL